MLYYETCVAFVDDMNFYIYIYIYFYFCTVIKNNYNFSCGVDASCFFASDNTDRANCLRQAGNSVFRGDVREETICILFVNQTLVSA